VRSSMLDSRKGDGLSLLHAIIISLNRSVQIVLVYVM
jgi:hypothetical protein